MPVQSRVQIGEVIRNAVVFNVKNWFRDAMNSDSLLESVEHLFVLFEEREIEYVLVGGIALSYYVEGRNTEVLDLILAYSVIEKMPEIKIVRQDMYFIRGEYEELQLDILLTKNPLFEKVRKEYSATRHFLDRDIQFATVEGLILLKLYALPSLYRQGNFARVGIYENDIATLMHEYNPDISNLVKVLSSFVSDSDLVEIHNIISDIQERIERFRKGSA